MLTEVLTTSLAEAGFELTAMESYLDQVTHALRLQTPLDLATFTHLWAQRISARCSRMIGQARARRPCSFPTRELWTQADRGPPVPAPHRRAHGTRAAGSLTGSAIPFPLPLPPRLALIFALITLAAALGVVGIVCLQFRVLLPGEPGALACRMRRLVDGRVVYVCSGSRYPTL